MALWTRHEGYSTAARGFIYTSSSAAGVVRAPLENLFVATTAFAAALNETWRSWGRSSPLGGAVTPPANLFAATMTLPSALSDMRLSPLRSSRGTLELEWSGFCGPPSPRVEGERRCGSLGALEYDDVRAGRAYLDTIFAAPPTVAGRRAARHVGQLYHGDVRHRII